MSQGAHAEESSSGPRFPFPPRPFSTLSLHHGLQGWSDDAQNETMSVSACIAARVEPRVRPSVTPSGGTIVWSSLEQRIRVKRLPVADPAQNFGLVHCLPAPDRRTPLPICLPSSPLIRLSPFLPFQLMVAARSVPVTFPPALALRTRPHPSVFYRLVRKHNAVSPTRCGD